MPSIRLASQRWAGTGQLKTYYRTGTLGAGISGIPIVSNLKGWWTASASQVTKDINDYVSSVADMSGVGVSLVEATGIYQPKWVDSYLNGRPALRFGTGGAQPSRLTATGFSLASPYTVYLVMRHTWVSGWQILNLSASAIFYNNAAYGTPEVNFTDSATAEARNTDLATNTWAVVTLKCYGATNPGSSIQINSLTPTTASRANSGDIGAFVIGGYPNIKLMDFTDLAIYAGIHDSTQTAAMQTYFKSLNGL